jgi:hypothetical protein
VSSYQTFPFAGFGKGLNLLDKPDAVDPAECIDAMNVLFSDRGAIEQRGGYVDLTEVALTNRVDSLESFYTTAGTKQILAGCGTRLEGLSNGGAVVDSEAGLSAGPYSFARFGKPNEEVCFAGNGTDTLRKWNGVEWTAPTVTVDGEAGQAMPKPGALCAWSEGGNRLVAARFATGTGGPGGKVSSPDHVYFSDAGDPTSWSSTSYVQLSPGDGERIQAIVAWRELVFVFKETSFFVFYGASVDNEGNPVFNFRSVEAGVGLASPRAICVHPSGVYFMARNGVYRTTGQEPVLISESVEPIWDGNLSPYYTGGKIAHGSITDCAMEAYRDQIYLSFPSATVNDRTLVYDPQGGWWGITDLPCAAMTVFRSGSEDELVFGYASGDKKVARHSRLLTNDADAAIASHWRSGWFDLGNPDIKKIRSTKLWGSGKAGVAVSKDFETGVGNITPLDFTSGEVDQWDLTTWGGGEWAEARGLTALQRRVAIRGTTFSLFFGNSILDQGFSMHRAEHLVSQVREPAREKT